MSVNVQSWFVACWRIYSPEIGPINKWFRNCVYQMQFRLIYSACIFNRGAVRPTTVKFGELFLVVCSVRRAKGGQGTALRFRTNTGCNSTRHLFISVSVSNVIWNKVEVMLSMGIRLNVLFGAMAVEGREEVNICERNWNLLRRTPAKY